MHVIAIVMQQKPNKINVDFDLLFSIVYCYQYYLDVHV